MSTGVALVGAGRLGVVLAHGSFCVSHSCMYVCSGSGLDRRARDITRHHSAGYIRMCVYVCVYARMHVCM